MTDRKRAIYVCMALVGAILAIYGYVWQCDFIDFDDNSHVYENAHVRDGLTWSSVTWAFTHFHAGQWIPLTWLSHMADVSMFGLEPGPHHLMAVMIHAATAILLFVTLGALGIRFWPSAIVAALFAVHPLNVESVAWVAERKNVLSTFFWVLAMLAYGRYVKAPGVLRMVLVAGAMALGLMCKGMLVTLPCALLLLDLWPLERWQSAGWRRVILEKLPLFALTIVFSVVTTRAAAFHGALVSEDHVPLMLRLTYVPANYLLYLGKLLVPVNLSLLYPNPTHAPVLLAITGSVVLLALTGLALRLRRHTPAVLVGWLWFLGTLFPVSGIVPLGKTIFAERFTHIPQIGIFIAAVCGLAAWAERRPKVLRPMQIAAGLTVLSFASVAFLYVQHWTDTYSIFTHAVRSHKNNYSAHGTIGWALSRQGRMKEAAAHYMAALNINPGHSEARANLGVVLSRAGETEAAMQQFRRALEYNPTDYSARFNLATHLIMLNRPAEAVEPLESLLQDRTPEPRLHYWLGRALEGAGRNAEAIKQYRIAVAYFPEDPAIREALAEAERKSTSPLGDSVPQ